MKKVDYNNSLTIGCDEVGVSDYLGPIVVCACLVEPAMVNFLKTLGVTDSKSLNNTTIRELAPTIMSITNYSVSTLSNKEYNEIYDKNSFNLNKIKAVLHNQTIINLINKYNYEYIVIDKFCTERIYFKYLNTLHTFKNVRFMEHSELKVTAIACASIIARFIFLTEMDRLSTELGTSLPRGCSKSVVHTSKVLINKYGTSILKQYAKYNFITTKKVLSSK